MSLWERDPNLVFEELIKYPNAYIENLCAAEFEELCEDDSFWIRLWQTKFTETPPEDNPKAAFYERNLFGQIQALMQLPEVRLRHGLKREIEYQPKEVIKEWHSIDANKIKNIKSAFEKYPIFYQYLRPAAIVSDRVDVYLEGLVRNPRITLSDLAAFNKLDDNDFIEDVFNSLSDEDYVAVIRNTSLLALIGIPLDSENCNIELLEKHFGLNVKHTVEDYDESLVEADEKGCIEAIEYLTQRAKEDLDQEDYTHILNVDLSFAIRHEDVEKQEELISQGADIITGTKYLLMAPFFRPSSIESVRKIIREHEDEFVDLLVSKMKRRSDSALMKRLRTILDDDESIELRRIVYERWREENADKIEKQSEGVKRYLNLN